MKKILLVGYNYCYEKEVSKKYDDALFVSARNIEDDITPQRIIALVGMFDAILLIGSTEHLSYKVAAIMQNKDILTEKDYPVDIDIVESEGENE